MIMRGCLRAGVRRPAGALLSPRWSAATPAPAPCLRGLAQVARAVQMSEHSLYLEEVAVSQSPKRLGALIKVIEAKGGKALLPSDRSGLHPLLIPLASDAPGSERVTCLLRWPKPSQHKEMTLPVVSMLRGGKSVMLLARSVDEYLHRLLAEEDAAGPGPKPLAEAAGADGMSLYKPGDLAASGLGAKIQMYIIKKVGMFPDVSEGLAKGHLQRGDVVSSLVASEWYMRNNQFPGWARPYEFAAELLVQVGKREEEARDMARVALRLPWWSLQGDYEAVRDVAQMRGSPAEVRYNLSEEAAAAAQAKMSNGVSFKQPRSSQDVAYDKACELLDMVVAGAEPSYDAVRERLSEQYRAAGLTDVANFISSAT